MHLKSNIDSVTVFAPASSENFAIGFNILGFPYGEIGDEVKLTKNSMG